MRYEITAVGYAGTVTFEIEAKSISDASRIARQQMRESGSSGQITGIRPVGATVRAG